jgi:hypothetical protein
MFLERRRRLTGLTSLLLVGVSVESSLYTIRDSEFELDTSFV